MTMSAVALLALSAAGAQACTDFLGNECNKCLAGNGVCYSEFDESSCALFKFEWCAGPPTPAPPTPPTPPTPPPQDPLPSIIFRLDDVSDFFRHGGVATVLDAFVQEGEVCSMGVIGGDWFGEEGSVNAPLAREAYQLGFEIFNHGDDASTLFSAVTKEEALEHLTNAEEEEFKPYASFVPHQNEWGQPAVEALREKGYTAISAAHYNMQTDITSTPMLLPQVTQTAAYVGWKPDAEKWQKTVDEIIPRCERAIRDDSVCVVMMHPQEFNQTFNPVSGDELRAVIREAKSKGWTVTTFRGFYNQVRGTTAAPVVSTATPEPTAATPEPTTETPEPTTATPEPTTETPEPTTATPEPTTETPEPTTATPEPTTETPIPTTVTPVPSSCSRLLGEWNGCINAQDCCGAGLYCKVESQWWASCRRL